MSENGAIDQVQFLFLMILYMLVLPIIYTHKFLLSELRTKRWLDIYLTLLLAWCH